MKYQIALLNADGTAAVSSGPGTNLFSPGHEFDMHFYLSDLEPADWRVNESEPFWSLPGLTYGDWKAGPLEDGSFSFSSKIELSKVLLHFMHTSRQLIAHFALWIIHTDYYPCDCEPFSILHISSADISIGLCIIHLYSPGAAKQRQHLPARHSSQDWIFSESSGETVFQEVHSS